MKQLGIKAQWVKPWTITTKDSDFSSELKNIFDEGELSKEATCSKSNREAYLFPVFSLPVSRELSFQNQNADRL